MFLRNKTQSVIKKGLIPAFYSMSMQCSKAALRKVVNRELILGESSSKSSSKSFHKPAIELRCLCKVGNSTSLKYEVKGVTVDFDF